MGKLQTSRFERLGARTYSIKGPGALVDLDEPVLGVIQLERQGGMESMDGGALSPESTRTLR